MLCCRKLNQSNSAMANMYGMAYLLNECINFHGLSDYHNQFISLGYDDRANLQRIIHAEKYITLEERIFNQGIKYLK